MKRAIEVENEGLNCIYCHGDNKYIMENGKLFGETQSAFTCFSLKEKREQLHSL